MRRITPDWQSASDETLYDIAGLDATPLRPLPRRARYQLVNTGAIAVVLIGRRRYVTRRAIQDFLRKQECRLVAQPNKR